MKDLTTNLETKLAFAINAFRSSAEAADEALRLAIVKFGQDVAEAHAEFELAAGLRVEGATAAMASQIRTFLGTATEAKPQTMFDVAAASMPPATTLEEAMDNARG